MLKLKDILNEVDQNVIGNVYDWNGDFQQFKTNINTAIEQAILNLEKGLKTKILQKSVKVRASRGYKQPIKYYIINKVIDVSVDNFYNDWVVVLKNERNKEFFLTPGFNITLLSGPVASEPTAISTPQKPTTPETNPTVPPEKSTVNQHHTSQPTKKI